MLNALFMTNDVALKCGVSAQTVRLWEKTGRLIATVRTPRGVRLFDPESVARLAEERRTALENVDIAAA